MPERRKKRHARQVVGVTRPAVTKAFTITSAIEKQYQEFLDFALGQLNENLDNPAVFEAIVSQFGPRLRDPKFWVPVFRHTVGPHKIQKNIWLSESTLEFFKTAYRELVPSNQDLVLAELVYAIESMTDPVNTKQWLVEAIKARVWSCAGENPEPFYESVKGNSKKVLIFLIDNGDPSGILYHFNRLVPFLGIGNNEAEKLAYVKSIFNERIRRDIDNDRGVKWNVEGIHNVLSESTARELARSVLASNEKIEKKLLAFKNANVLPLVPEKDHLTQLILSMRFDQISSYYRKYPDFFDKETIKSRLVELYKQEKEPSPDAIVEMMMTGKRPGGNGVIPFYPMHPAFPFYPMMTERPPWW